MNIRDEITKHSTESDKEILLWLLDRYHWSSQWSFVATCTHHRYGVLSYETTRVWAPTREGRILFAHEHLVTALKFYEDKENWQDVETCIGCYPGDAVDYGNAAHVALERFATSIAPEKVDPKN